MREHFYYGGGATQSTMHPIVLAVTLLAALGVLILPRRFAVALVLVVAFLTPFGQQLLIGGFHFFSLRIITLTGLARLLWLKYSSHRRLFGHGVLPIEKMFFVWANLHAVMFVLASRDTAAVTNQAGFLLDTCGAYILFRYFIQDREDVLRVTRMLVFIAAVLAACMSYEYASRVNVFSYISNFTIVPWVRDGRVRAQGIFANSITAGTFGATLFPLFFWLWKSGRKLLGTVGLVASSIIAVSAMASTGVMAYLAGILALCLWPIRKHMRPLRWGIVLIVLSLAMVMKAPVWFVIARVDFIGGHGWDRAALIDATVRHFSDWWLLGTRTNASWGTDTWDACNQFVSEAVSGGLTTFVLFVAILSRGFSMIGKARKRVEGSLKQEWFFWSLGAALYAHVMGFWGIDYFDIISSWWYLFLAMIPAATLLTRPIVVKESKTGVVPQPRYSPSILGPSDAAAEQPVGVCISRQLFS